jgi:hypothetical protein
MKMLPESRYAKTSARVVVAIPSTGLIHHACEESIRTMIESTTSADQVTLWWDNAQPHDRCRNRLLSRFLESGEWTHLLFIDTDVVVSPETIDRLLALNAPFACAPVPILHRRSGPRDVNHGVTVGTNIMIFDDPTLRGTAVAPDAADCGYRYLDPDDMPEQPFKCDATGLGLAMIERRVIERIETPWCEFARLEGNEHIGEDINFARKVRQAGFDIVVDPELSCDHFKHIDLTHIDLLYADRPPVSPWPSRQQPDDSRSVFVAARVPRTGWLDVRTGEVLAAWQRRYGDRMIVERVFAGGLIEWMNTLADRVAALDERFTHVLILADDVLPHESTLGLMASVDAPIVSALSRRICDREIRWSYWQPDPSQESCEPVSPQNIDLPSMTDPFEVPFVDPACLLVRRDALAHVRAAAAGLGHCNDAERTFVHRWCNLTSQATGSRPLQLPLTVERRAEIGLRGFLNLKMRLKDRLRAEQVRQPMHT